MSVFIAGAKSKASHCLICLSRVSQWSVFGPYLHILYTNNLLDIGSHAK